MDGLRKEFGGGRASRGTQSQSRDRVCFKVRGGRIREETECQGRIVFGGRG